MGKQKATHFGAPFGHLRNESFGRNVAALCRDVSSSLLESANPVGHRACVDNLAEAPAAELMDVFPGAFVVCRVDVECRSNFADGGEVSVAEFLQLFGNGAEDGPIDVAIEHVAGVDERLCNLERVGIGRCGIEGFHLSRFDTLHAEQLLVPALFERLGDRFERIPCLMCRLDGRYSHHVHGFLL